MGEGALLKVSPLSALYREHESQSGGKASSIFDRPITVCVGIAAWKRQAIKALLQEDEGPQLAFCKSSQEAIAIAHATGGQIAVWPSRAPAGLVALAKKTETPLVFVEDGFLRSNGLGAECRAPLSIVVDHSGIHFDPAGPSDIEAILATRRFEQCLATRAERLIERIVKLGLTKYNLVAKDGLPNVPGGRIVLVAGQVEDDLSFRLGGAGIASNLELLARARALEPYSWILYKPHPDVEAGLRRGAHPDIEIFRYADVIVRDVSIPALLERVDAVHVLTSLLGFEALLRRREVVVHGAPFYAGWGLTRDLVPLPRRGRRLALGELAAAALILYPRYLDPQTGNRTTVETAIERLAAGQASGGGALPLLRRWQGRVAKTIDVSGAASR